jgi:hypothetical protein
MTESAEALKSDVTPAGRHFCGARPERAARLGVRFEGRGDVTVVADRVE